VTLSQPALVAIGIFLAYTALVAVMWKVTGTRYDALVESRSTILRGIVLSIGVGALLLVVATTWLGWWQSALFEDDRSGPTWVLIVPVLFGVVALLNIASIDFRAPNARLVPLILVGTLVVGFAEELATRGILVVGFREAGWSELAVWLVSSILFGLLHAINVLFGQSGKATVTQIVMAFIAGTALFVTLVSTGTLIVGMLLHALWDWGTLGMQATGGRQKPIAGVLGLVTYAAALASIWFVVTAV
jgi:membrane protease YdiL (CAAX protease family)